jgi:hypothetical protein
MAATRPRNRKTAKTRGPVYWGTVIFFSLALGMVFAMPTVLLIGMGLLPTFAALLVDVHPRKFAAWSVGLLNGSGLLPYLGKLWAGGNTLDGAVAVLSDLLAWLVIYSAAGVGWLIYMGMPALGALVMEVRARQGIRRLKSEKEALIAEWGDQVAGEPDGR